MKPGIRLRNIPAVEKVLQALGDVAGLPRPAVVAVVRRELAALRTEKKMRDLDAALVLMVCLFTSGDGKEVIISRGERVQIGGGFRIPKILEASGARLREVGATNKTSMEDYRRAIGKQTALILKVHRSNFFMGGFVESPATEEIAALAKKKRVRFVEDLGSGAMVETEELATVEHE